MDPSDVPKTMKTRFCGPLRWNFKVGCFRLLLLSYCYVFLDLSDVVQIVQKPLKLQQNSFAYLTLLTCTPNTDNMKAVMLHCCKEFFSYIWKAQLMSQVYLRALKHINLKAVYFFLNASVSVLSQQGLLWAFQENVFMYIYCMYVCTDISRQFHYNVTQTIRIVKNELPLSQHRTQFVWGLHTPMKRSYPLNCYWWQITAF